MTIIIKMTSPHQRHNKLKARLAAATLLVAMTSMAASSSASNVNINTNSNNSFRPASAGANGPPAELYAGAWAPPSGPIAGLFGKLAKMVVYGGASVASWNSKLLCPILSQSSELGNDIEPTLEFVYRAAGEGADELRRLRLKFNEPLTGALVDTLGLGANQMSYVYVHGWMGGPRSELWLGKAAAATLSAGTLGANVILVDWSQHAHGSLYSATQNSFKVSQRLAARLGELARVAKLAPELMHCMGHSIGAHICGQAARQAFGSMAPVAERGAKLGRITGLDPGGFCYELGVEREASFLGLKPSDAQLVDALYTNRSPFGNRYQVAQFNVRVNNGKFQRNCSVMSNPERASEYFHAAAKFLAGSVPYLGHALVGELDHGGQNAVLTCDHYYATKFAGLVLSAAAGGEPAAPSGAGARRSAPSCSLVAYECPSHEAFARGHCGQCDTPSQCYPVDFEYQRGRGASVGHHLAQLRTYGNESRNHEHGQPRGALEHHEALAGPRQPAADDEEPPDGVAYARRRVYYLRVNENVARPCSPLYRLRVFFGNQSARSVPPVELKIRLLDADNRTLQVFDVASEAPAAETRLWGPWAAPADDEGAERLGGMYGLAPSSLSALVEQWAANERPLAQVARWVHLVDPSGRLAASGASVAMVRLDYLASAERDVRRKFSRLFRPNSIRLVR